MAPDPVAGNQYWNQSQKPRSGVPIWVLGGWLVVCLFGAAAGVVFQLMLIGQGCESTFNLAGCEFPWGLRETLITAVAVAAPVALFVWALIQPTPTVKAVAFMLMPAVVLASIVGSLVVWP